MDFVNKIVGGEESKNEDRTSQQPQEQQEEKSSGGFMDKLNSVAGGGQQSEKSEDAIDKGMSSHPVPQTLRTCRGDPTLAADQHG